jgi:5'-methylthioadenosine phosphorylase
METAIIAGTGIYAIPGVEFNEQVIETEYGPALINVARIEGQEIAFLARHGLQHTVPPHKINYRANIRALQKLGVKRALATFAVGSISRGVPPQSVAVVSDFLDFTSGREHTFFNGGDSGLAHTSMDEAYCPTLRARMIALAPQVGLPLLPAAVYVATNGPRFESPAEIRMYERLGGDVVGMTGVPEVCLAHEVGIHYAALAYSINWAAGLEAKTVIVNDGIAAVREKMILLLVRTLRETPVFACGCESARL